MLEICSISGFKKRSTEIYMETTKRVIRYAKGTVAYGIQYMRGKEDLIAFTYSSYVGDVDDVKSTLRYVFMFGEGDVSWTSKKQPFSHPLILRSRVHCSSILCLPRVRLKRILDKKQIH